MVVDIRNYRRHSNNDIFENSAFFLEYINGKTILPPKPLTGTDILIPHVFIGDEGFVLQIYFMKPYPNATVISDVKKKKFNMQLNRARRVIENVFGILDLKWQVFLRSIKTTECIVKAVCCLHNYIMIKNNNTFIKS